MHLLSKEVQLILHNIRGILIPEPLGIFTHQLRLVPFAFQLRKNVCGDSALANASTAIKIDYFQGLTSKK